MDTMISADMDQISLPVTPTIDSLPEDLFQLCCSYTDISDPFDMASIWQMANG
jgi:hypothetical protein